MQVLQVQVYNHELNSIARKSHSKDFNYPSDDDLVKLQSQFNECVQTSASTGVSARRDEHLVVVQFIGCAFIVAVFTPDVPWGSAFQVVQNGALALKIALYDEVNIDGLAKNNAVLQALCIELYNGGIVCVLPKAELATRLVFKHRLDSVQHVLRAVNYPHDSMTGSINRAKDHLQGD